MPEEKTDNLVEQTQTAEDKNLSDIEVEEKATGSKKKKKKGPKLLRGRAQAYIKSTYNNTIITITDHNGNAICSSSAGKCGFKAAKKATPYAAGVIVKSLVDKIKAFGVKDVDVFVRGVGMGREAGIRAFGTNGITVASIKDLTPVPHNGCRSRKARRV
jgi:small subunit ribosomal protein S11